MTHNDWVQNQFTLLKRRGPSYRNVLLLTSFIETAIRDEVSKGCTKQRRLDFKPSLGKLGLEIDQSDEKRARYSQDCQYKTSCLMEINRIRVQRNELLHDIIGQSLPEKQIKNTIKDMKKDIEKICTSSSLFRKYFRGKYGFDPARLVQ